MSWMVGYKKNNTEFETVVKNNYCTHNPLNNIKITGRSTQCCAIFIFFFVLFLVPLAKPISENGTTGICLILTNRVAVEPTILSKDLPFISDMFRDVKRLQLNFFDNSLIGIFEKFKYV